MASGVCVLALILGGWVRWWHRLSPATVPPATLPLAERRLLEAVTRAPASGPAHRALASYYLQNQQPFEALWELEQSRALDPQDRATRVLLATVLAMSRLYPEAETELHAALTQPPRSQAGCADMAALSLATGRPEQALSVLQAAPDLAGWPQGQLLLGRAYEGSGQLPQARRAYQRFIQLAPGSSEGPFRLARLLLTSGDPRAARAILQPALSRRSHEPRLLLLLALTYSARWGDGEQPDQEGELLSKAVRMGAGAERRGDDVVPVRLAMGELYLRHRRFKEAGGHLAWVAEKADLPAAHRGLAAALAGLARPAEASYQRGMADVLEGHADLALDEFRALAARDPRDARAPQLISQTYAQMNQLNDSLKAAQVLYERGDRSPELFERLASLYLLTYDRRAARQLCEAWRHAQPDSGRPLAYLGKVDLADLRLTEATRDYQEAIAKEPKRAEPRLGLADALTHQPSPEHSRQAVDLLRQAVALAPGNAQAHYQLGVQLQQMGQLEEARRELLRALDENPTLAAAENNLVQVAAALRLPALSGRFEALMRGAQGRKREQDAAWRRRWERRNDPQVYYSLALLLARAGDLAAAEPQLQRALELRPGWPEATRLRERVARLLDGLDPDGRRLVQLRDEEFTTETRRGQKVRTSV